MMDNPFTEEYEEWEGAEPEEDWPEDEAEEDWGEVQDHHPPPIHPTKAPPQKDKTEIGIDRNGLYVNVGDRVKLVGDRRDSTVHFNGSMLKYLNTGKILTIKEVRPYSPHPCFKIHGGADWSWSHMNVEKVLIDPPKKAEPTTFDPSLLDL